MHFYFSSIIFFVEYPKILLYIKLYISYSFFSNHLTPRSQNTPFFSHTIISRLERFFFLTIFSLFLFFSSFWPHTTIKQSTTQTRWRRRRRWWWWCVIMLLFAKREYACVCISVCLLLEKKGKRREKN